MRAGEESLRSFFRPHFHFGTRLGWTARDRQFVVYVMPRSCAWEDGRQAGRRDD
jgi:hypothetical protein